MAFRLAGWLDRDDRHGYISSQSEDVSSAILRYRLCNRLWLEIHSVNLKPSRFVIPQLLWAAATMMEETGVDDFADRLKHEFEDRASDGDMDESQDWFVNDKPDLERAPSPVASERSEKDASPAPNVASVAVNPLTKEPSGKAPPVKNTAATADDVGSIGLLIEGALKGLTAF